MFVPVNEENLEQLEQIEDDEVDGIIEDLLGDEEDETELENDLSSDE